MSGTNCPSREDLLAYHRGELSEELADPLISHIGSCVDCQAVLETFDDVDDTFIARLRQPAAESPYAAEPQRQELVARAKALVPAGGQSVDPPSTETFVVRELGEYQLLEKLGQGGMGAVYKARQTKLKKIVALKVLPKERMQDQRAVARFEREMEAVGAVDHPNIVRAMDAREIDGTHVLVMEHVDGLDLTELVKRCGPLGIADACELIRQAALGLQCAHENDLVHRDIKPSNLMLSVGGRGARVERRGVKGEGSQSAPPAPHPSSPAPLVKILDLGLALLGTDQPAGEEMTGTGIAMGTSDYMAPEQAVDSHNVDIRADIYALGCTLFKLLTGRAPFSDAQHKSNLEKLMAHMKEPPPSIELLRGNVPKALAALIARMLAKEPAERPATPAEVAAALAPFSADADLAALATWAQNPAEARPKLQPSHGSTEELHSSALAGTAPYVPRPSAPGFAGGRVAGLAAGAGSRPSPGKAEGSGQGVSKAPRSLWQSARVSASRHRGPVKIAIAAMFLGFGLMAALGIIITIRHPDGRETVVDVPEGSRVAMKGDRMDVTLPGVKAESGKRKAEEGKKPPAVMPITIGPPVKVEAVKIEIKPDPKALDIKPGGAMSQMALVSNPAQIEGLRSWTIATATPRGRVGLAFRPDGRVLATDSRDGVIRLLDRRTGRLLRALTGHNGHVKSVCWSPDGKYLASGSDDRTIRIWDPGSGMELRKLVCTQAVAEVVWSPDGRRLASAHLLAGEIRIWELPSGQTIRKWKTDTPHMCRLAWSPDGKRLASTDGGCKRNAFIWDAQTGELLHKLSRQAVNSAIAWSPNGNLLAVASGGVFHDSIPSQVEVFDALSGESRFRFSKVCVERLAIAWSPDGARLTAGSWSTSRKLWTWDVAKRELLPDADMPADISMVTALAYTPDGREMAVSECNGTIRLIEAGSGKPVWHNSGHRGVSAEAGIVPSPCGEWLAVPDGQGVIRIVATETGECLQEIPSPGGGRGLRGLVWSPDAKHLATGYVALICHFVHIWEVSSGRQVVELPGGTAQRNRPRWESWPHIFWSPDGNVLAVIGEDARIRVFDFPAAKLLWTANDDPQAKGSVRTVAWSPDGKSMAVCLGGDVKVLDAASGHVLKTLAGGPTTKALWLRDGKGLLYNGHVWDLVSAKPVREIAFQPGSASLVRDGELLVYTSDCTHVCDSRTGTLLRSFEIEHLPWFGSSRQACRVTMPDGQLMLARSPNLHMYSMEDGRVVRTLLPMGKGQYAVISPEGHYHGPPGVEKDLVYIALTESGEQLTLTPAEFSKKYGWKNEPGKVGIGKSEVGKPKAESGKGKAEKEKEEPKADGPASGKGEAP